MDENDLFAQPLLESNQLYLNSRLEDDVVLDSQPPYGHDFDDQLGNEEYITTTSDNGQVQDSIVWDSQIPNTGYDEGHDNSIFCSLRESEGGDLMNFDSQPPVSGPSYCSMDIDYHNQQVVVANEFDEHMAAANGRDFSFLSKPVRTHTESTFFSKNVLSEQGGEQAVAQFASHIPVVSNVGGSNVNFYSMEQAYYNQQLEVHNHLEQQVETNLLNSDAANPSMPLTPTVHDASSVINSNRISSAIQRWEHRAELRGITRSPPSPELDQYGHAKQIITRSESMTPANDRQMSNDQIDEDMEEDDDEEQSDEDDRESSEEEANEREDTTRKSRKECVIENLEHNFVKALKELWCHEQDIRRQELVICARPPPTSLLLPTDYVVASKSLMERPRNPAQSLVNYLYYLK